jgi:4-carboxymuconolactone decarboxylase
MKLPNEFSILLGILIVFALAGYSSPQKKTKKPFRLQEPRLAPLVESEWTQRQANFLTPLKDDNGKILNVFATLARHPKLLEEYSPFIWYILREQTLSARDREILILRIGWLCQAEYEFGQHRITGKRAGLTEEEILRITRGPDDPGWRARESALLRAADELFHDAIISDATWKALSRHYDEKQLMDVVFTVGQYNMVSWMLNSFGVQLEEGVPGFPEGPERKKSP